MNRFGVVLAVLAAMAMAAAGCSDDDAGAPSSTTLAPSSSTTTTTTAAPTTTTPPEVPSAFDWPVVELPFGGDGDVVPVLIDAGAEPREALRYGGTGSTAWGITTSGTWEDPVHGTVPLEPTSYEGTSEAGPDGLVIEFTTFGGEPVTTPVAVGIDPHGLPTVRTPSGESLPTDRHIEVSMLLHPRLVPLPDEPVGVGARWASRFPSPDPRLPAPEYELLASDGTIVTVRATGTVEGADLSFPGELRGTNAPSTGTFDGVLTFDRATGAVSGAVTVAGTTQTNDGPIEFVRRLVTESATDDAGSLGGRSDWQPYGSGPVALRLHYESTVDGEPDTTFTSTYLGRNLGPHEDRPTLNFAGVAAADGRGFTTYDGAVEASWPPDENEKNLETWLDLVLPAFVDDEFLDVDPPFGGLNATRINTPSESGVAPVVWEIAELSEDEVVVRADQPFDEEVDTRGDAFRIVGTVTGEFRVNRHNILDVEGWMEAAFDVGDPSSTPRYRQTWTASPAPAGPDLTTWRSPGPGIERFADLRAEANDDPEFISRELGYGGSGWDGRLEITQFWSQLDRLAEPTTVESVVAVESRLTEAGQWLTMTPEAWTADGPPFPPSDDDDGDTGPPFALVLAADGRVGDASMRDTDEVDTRAQRDWFGRVLIEALPAVPDERVGPGAAWQVRLQSEPAGSGLHYTVVEMRGRVVTLEVEGGFGAYIGDRYDGYTIDASTTGTLEIDLAAGIPLVVDMESTGTITFGTGGEPDPATAEPWRSTLSIRAVADDE